MTPKSTARPVPPLARSLKEFTCVTAMAYTAVVVLTMSLFLATPATDAILMGMRPAAAPAAAVVLLLAAILARRSKRLMLIGVGVALGVYAGLFGSRIHLEEPLSGYVLVLAYLPWILIESHVALLERRERRGKERHA